MMTPWQPSWRTCGRRRSGQRLWNLIGSAAALPEPIVSISLRAWPTDFPEDIAVQRRIPYESRADSVMYRQVLAQLAGDRGWVVQVYDARDVEDQAVRILGDRADEILNGPRSTLGPPWTKDHRMALAATIVALADSG
jgi:hypothetical protein